MKTLSEIIAEAIEKYHRGLMQKRVLKTMEEIEANTDIQKTYLVGSDAVAELNNKLGNCSLEQEGNDFYITGADAVRKKLGDSIKFYETNIKLSQSNFVSIECGFRPKYIVYTMVWSGAVAARFLDIEANREKRICCLDPGATSATNVPVTSDPTIVFETYDTGIRLRAAYNHYTYSAIYFYIFG